MRSLILPVIAAIVLAAPAAAQTLQQRIDETRRRIPIRPNDSSQAERELRRQTIAKVNAPLPRVELNLLLRDAVAWWTAASGVPVVVNWRAMENEGVYPEAPVQLDLSAIPAGQALTLLVRTANPDVRVVWDVEPGFIHLMTQAQADRMPVLAVYDVADMLTEIPAFTDFPAFDLGSALESRARGGSNGRFFGDAAGGDNPRPTKQQRGEQLAQLIRDTIEPANWDENGGIHGHSVRYWNGRLIIRAPKYVHRQIGIPVMTRRVSTPGG